MGQAEKLNDWLIMSQQAHPEGFRGKAAVPDTTRRRRSVRWRRISELHRMIRHFKVYCVLDAQFSLRKSGTPSGCRINE